jgi:hypothetical protein
VLLLVAAGCGVSKLPRSAALAGRKERLPPARSALMIVMAVAHLKHGALPSAVALAGGAAHGVSGVPGRRAFAVRRHSGSATYGWRRWTGFARLRTRRFTISTQTEKPIAK